jgi:hypothetical protein
MLSIIPGEEEITLHLRDGEDFLAVELSRIEQKLLICLLKLSLRETGAVYPLFRRVWAFLRPWKKDNPEQFETFLPEFNFDQEIKRYSELCKSRFPSTPNQKY